MFDPSWGVPALCVLISAAALIYGHLASRAFDRDLQKTRDQQD